MTLDSFRLYVGGLSVNITDDILEEIFGQYGRVNFVKIVRDYTSGELSSFYFFPPEVAIYQTEVCTVSVIY